MWLDLQPPTGSQPADRERALIVASDTAPACSFEGFARIAVVERGAARPVTPDEVDLPAAARRVVVQSEASAFAGIEWTSSVDCPLVTSFEVTLPGQSGAVRAGVTALGGSSSALHLCAGSMLLGPMSSTSVGTVAFPDSEGS